jgi:hypothetical protein
MKASASAELFLDSITRVFLSFLMEPWTMKNLESILFRTERNRESGSFEWNQTMYDQVWDLNQNLKDAGVLEKLFSKPLVLRKS